MVLRSTMHAAALFTYLFNAASLKDEAGGDAITIGFYPLEIDFNPVIAISTVSKQLVRALFPKRARRICALGDEQIQESVSIVVCRGYHLAASQVTPNRPPSIRNEAK